MLFIIGITSNGNPLKSEFIPTVLKALKDNGSPPPSFKSDEERTYFEVELTIHPAFEQTNQVDGNEVVNELNAIDDRINQLISIVPNKVRDNVRDVAGDIAGDIVRAIDRAEVVDIAIEVREVINEKLVKILLFCQKPKQRKEILKEIGLVNNVKNYDTYVAPLVQMGWVKMTIPDKPTSPKQQYRTALKGSIISGLLNYIEDGE